MAICALLITSAYKYTKSVAKETKIFDLSKQNHELHNDLSKAEAINNNILNSFKHIDKVFCIVLNQLYLIL